MPDAEPTSDRLLRAAAWATIIVAVIGVLAFLGRPTLASLRSSSPDPEGGATTTADDQAAREPRGEAVTAGSVAGTSGEDSESPRTTSTQTTEDEAPDAEAPSADPGSASGSDDGGVEADGSASTIVYLADLDPSVGSWDRDAVGTLSIDGTEWEKSLSQYDCFAGGRFSWEYTISGRFRTFQTTVGMTDATRTDWVTEVEVFGDRVLLGRTRISVGNPHEFVLDVTDVDVLRVSFVTVSEVAGCGTSDPIGPAFATPTLTDTLLPGALGGPRPDFQVAYLEWLEPTRGGWDNDESGSLPIDGEVYTRSMSQYDCFASGGPYVFEYNLGRDYDRLETFVGMTDYTRPDWRSRVDFAVEGEIAKSVVVTVGEPAPVVIELGRALTMTITITTLSDVAGCGSTDPIGPALGKPTLLTRVGS